MDVDTIPPGTDFEEFIRNWIENADVILVLIGDNWLDRDDEGRRRLDHPDDFVRLEIQAALEQGRKIVPVMVEGAVMPRATDLPESIRGLVRIQSFELSDGRWISDLERLVQVIDSARAGPSLPVTRQPPAPAPRRRVGAVIEDAPGWAKAAGTAALVGVAAVTILIVTGGSESSGGCANQTIPPDVRDRLSVAEGTKRPAVEGSVYYGTCGGTDWAIAEFPGGGQSVFKETGFTWTKLGSVATAKCQIPSDLRDAWGQGGC